MARLVFLGTPEVAVEPLRTLVAMGHTIVLVVSRPDKRRGRGSILVPSPVKAAAVELGLEVTSTLDDVLDAGAELGVVVAYGRIIPAGVLERLPMVNLHFSRLPRWRGAAPVERAILAGDGETGVSLMAVDAGLDTGDVYAEEGTTIDQTESVDDLRRRLAQIGCRLLEKHLTSGAAGLPVPRPQVGQPTYAEKIRPGELELHWEMDASHLRRVILLGRAWTTFRGRRLRVLRAEGVVLHREESPAASDGLHTPQGGITTAAEGDSPGALHGEEVIAGGGTRLHLVIVQPEGKQPMEVSDWLRGVRPQPGEAFGS